MWKVSKYGEISGPYCPAFGLNKERYEVSLRIQSECGKIRTRKYSVFGHSSRSGSVILTHFMSLFPFYTLFYTSKNIERYNDVFRGYRKGPVTWNKLITMFILRVFSVYGYSFIAHHSHLRPTCNRGSFCPLAPQLFVNDGNFYFYYVLNFLIYISNTLQY